MVRAIAFFPAIVILSLLALLAVAQPQKQPRSVIAVFPEHFPPHYVLNADEDPDGFGIATMKALAERANLQLELKPVKSWAEAYKALEDKKAHIIPNLGISAERKEWVQFTAPLETIDIAVFTRDDFSAIKNLDDLETHIVGTVTTNIATQFFAQRPNIAAKEFTTIEEALFHLVAGRIDAFAAPREVVQQILLESELEKKIQISIPSLIEVKRAVGIRKDLKSLHHRLDKAVTEFVGSEDYRNIYKRWYGLPAPRFNPQDLIWFLLTLGSAAILALLVWKNYSVGRLNKKLKKTIDDQRAAEKKLKHNQEKLAVAQSLARLGSWEWDLKTNAVEWSDELYEIIGISKEEFRGTFKHANSFFENSEDGPNITENPHDIIDWAQKGKPITYKVKRPDGTYRILSGIHHVSLNDQGKPIKIIGTVQDVTEQRAAETALRESEAKYRQLTESIQEGIWVCDQRGFIVLSNPSMANMIGYNQVELMARPVFDFIFAEDIPLADDIFKRSQKGLQEQFEFKIRHRNGSAVYVRMSTAPIMDRGEFRGLRAFVTDITQNLQREREKHQLESRLRQLQKMEALGTLAGGIAHDINNILQGMYLSISVAMDTLGKKHPVSEKLQVALKFGTRGRDLVKQILAFSRKDEQQKVAVDLSQTLSDNLKLIKATIPKHIQIEHEFDVTEAPIQGDPSQLSQVIMNLCANAAYAMKDTGGRLHISLEQVELSQQNTTVLGLRPGHYFKCSVTDTGPGIPAEIRERIFDPFFTTKPVGEGTGMGLAVVHGIIENHEGTIFVDNNEGSGTRFTFYLEAAENVEPQRSIRHQESRVQGEERILVIEDEVDLSQLEQELLERHGYQVTVCNNSLQALELFKASPEDFDLVITDQNMPELTGLQLSEQLLLIKPELPVILCTGHSDLITQEKIQKMGIATYATKPITPPDLVRLVRETLDLYQISSTTTSKASARPS